METRKITREDLNNAKLNFMELCQESLLQAIKDDTLMPDKNSQYVTTPEGAMFYIGTGIDDYSHLSFECEAFRSDKIKKWKKSKAKEMFEKQIELAKKGIEELEQK